MSKHAGQQLFNRWLADIVGEDGILKQKFRELTDLLSRFRYGDGELEILRKQVLLVVEEENVRRKQLALKRAAYKKVAA